MNGIEKGLRVRLYPSTVTLKTIKGGDRFFTGTIEAVTDEGVIILKDAVNGLPGSAYQLSAASGGEIPAWGQGARWEVMQDED